MTGGRRPMGRLSGRHMRSSRCSLHCVKLTSVPCTLRGRQSSSMTTEHQLICVHAQVDNKDVLNCYYAHAEDSLQARASPYSRNARLLQSFTEPFQSSQKLLPALADVGDMRVHVQLRGSFHEGLLCRGGAIGCWKEMTMWCWCTTCPATRRRIVLCEGPS